MNHEVAEAEVASEVPVDDVDDEVCDRHVRLCA